MNDKPNLEYIFQHDINYCQENSCDECSYLKCWDERHPYGMGYANETLCECECNDATECEAAKVKYEIALEEWEVEQEL